MAFKIKQKPEDFKVSEIHTLPISDSGVYGYYNLLKTNYTTQKAVETAARKLRKRAKYINFSGNKDKYAVTEQVISILHGPKTSLDLEDIKLVYLGRGSQRVNLGTASGNRFEIVVRNIEKPPRAVQVPNYYDDQRFGNNRNNHIIGKLLIQKRFKEACGLIPETAAHLKDRPNDFVSALRKIPKRTLRLYPHAYQSYLWNKLVSREIEKGNHFLIESSAGMLAIPLEKMEGRKISVIGYATGLSVEEDKLLLEEGISVTDFIVKEIPEFDLRGDEREMFAEIRGLDISPLEDDEFNPGKKKCTLKFALQNGSYATIVIKALFS